jgi:hypothetical protein
MLKSGTGGGVSNPHHDGRRVGDTEQNCLTSRTSCSNVYNIEYKLYIYIYMIFCKIKNNCFGLGQHYGPRLRSKHRMALVPDWPGHY